MAKTCAVDKKTKKGGRMVSVCDGTRSALLGALEEIQDKKGVISDQDMQALAERFDIHPVEVYSVATFYAFLSPQKKGKHVIRVSNCISCEMAGNKKIVEAFEKALKIKTGQTTGDGKFRLEMTSCIGMCDQAPAIMVDDKLIGNVTPGSVKKIIREIK